ncbi:MAG: endonuclease/exonuclease/phosphatase family protein [Akkermansiaceae bacterium]
MAVESEWLVQDQDFSVTLFAVKRRNFLMGAGVVTCGRVIADEADIQQVNRLRVLCYNIHFCKGADERFDVERIAKVIRAEAPDLVALQEIDVRTKRSGKVHQLQMLAELTGMHGRFGPTQDYHGGLYGNGILSRHPFEDLLIEPLPYTPASRDVITYPRGLIAATVSLGEGRSIRIVSTHFQHNLEEDRVAQAKAVNELFGDAEKDQIPTILAGDINARPGSEPMKVLGDHWEHVAGIEMDQISAEEGGKWEIDHILLRKGDKLSAKETKIIDDRTASDHRPILAVIETAVR